MDNDVLIKAAALDLCDALVVAGAGVLGQAPFVVADALRRQRLRGDRGAALDRARSLVTRCCTLEPTELEVALAAAIEREALVRDLPLDGGESQLTAIVALRSIAEMHTSDKRAVGALEALLDNIDALGPLPGRVRCLEQLVGEAVRALGAGAVGSAVCAEPDVDKALTICSECHSRSGRAMNATALAGYVAKVRGVAPRLLAA